MICLRHIVTERDYWSDFVTQESWLRNQSAFHCETSFHRSPSVEEKVRTHIVSLPPSCLKVPQIQQGKHEHMHFREKETEVLQVYWTIHIPCTETWHWTQIACFLAQCWTRDSRERPSWVHRPLFSLLCPWQVGQSSCSRHSWVWLRILLNPKHPAATLGPLVWHSGWSLSLHSTTLIPVHTVWP